MYTFEHLIDAQMEVRKILIQSGVDMDVANNIFIQNVTQGCTNISTFNRSTNDFAAEEKGPSAEDA
jgi:hypothetical protein